MDFSQYYITICLVMLSTRTSPLLYISSSQRGSPCNDMSEYAFKVLPVEHCPTSKEGWGMASSRLGCNSTHGYQCVPNKHLTSLIEFCYPMGVHILFEKGSCLELAAHGFLNHVPCSKTFKFGCPDEFYFSNEIYKYPSCLAIDTALKCFYADFTCIYSKLIKNHTRVVTNQTKVMINQSVICGEENCFNSINVTAILMAVIFGIISLILASVLLVKRRNTRLKKKKDLQDLENAKGLL